MDTVLWLCPSLPTETLKWLSSLPILMQESFWWWQCSDRYIVSLSPHLHAPFPPFSPSLISLMVSVDVKHHVYLLTYWARGGWDGIKHSQSISLQKLASQRIVVFTVEYVVIVYTTERQIWSLFIKIMHWPYLDADAMVYVYWVGVWLYIYFFFLFCVWCNANGRVAMREREHIDQAGKKIWNKVDC